jgi:hypothetical protein
VFVTNDDLLPRQPPGAAVSSCAGLTSATRSVDLIEPLGLRNITAKQANSGRSKQSRTKRGALAHLGPPDLKPADVLERIYCGVPTRHPAVHLELRRVRRRVQRRDYRMRLEQESFRTIVA